MITMGQHSSVYSGNEYTNQSSIQRHQPEYGPHKCFSGNYEWLYTEELGHIKEIEVICLLDLLLQQLAGPCKYSGYIHWTTLEHSLSCTCAVIQWNTISNRAERKVLYIRGCEWHDVK